MADRLTKDDLKIVRNELLKAASKWYDLGLELGLSVDYLDTINKDNPQDCLREMLTYWLSRLDLEPSWKQVITALRSQAVNYHALAEEIEQTYFTAVNSIQPSDQWKHELIQSMTFKGLTSSQVSRSQVEKAKQCIKHGGTYTERYKLVDFEKLLNKNQKLGRADSLSAMICCFDRLLEFIIGLLKPHRPPGWHFIETDDADFKIHVSCMQGYEEILKTAGYTERKETRLRFPIHIHVPDKAKVTELAAELLMAKLEVEQMKSMVTETNQKTTSRYNLCASHSEDDYSTCGQETSAKANDSTEELHDNGIQERSSGHRVIASLDNDNHADHSLTDTTMVVKPNGDQIKGHEKSLMGGGKLVSRQKSRRRHKSDLQPEDHKMVVSRQKSRRRHKSDLQPGDRKMSLQDLLLRSKSLSVPTLSTVMYQGVEYNFTNKPDSDLFCQKCEEIANEPHQTSCCSSLLCRSCIPDRGCPICQKSGICKSCPDGRSNKRIQQMEVICPNAPRGLVCQWRGELSAVAEHRLECLREIIPCPYSKIGCKEEICRCDVKTHKEEQKQVHLDLSMEMVVSLTTTVEEVQKQLKQQNDTINSLIEKLKKSQI